MRMALFGICFFLYLILCLLSEYCDLESFPLGGIRVMGSIIVGLAALMLLTDWEKKRK